MPVQNIEVADVLVALADLSEIDGDNPHRVRAYRTAARTVSHLDEPLHEWIDADADLTGLPGVGSEIAAKIREIVQTGRLGTLDRLAERVPLSLQDLLALSGVGAKQVRTLHAELGITTLDELVEALDDGRVESLHGFGAKRVRQFRAAAEREIARERRWRIDLAERLSQPLVEDLQSHEDIEDVYVAGSLRRRCETIGDVDLVVVTPHLDEAAALIAVHEDVSDSERDELGVKARFRSGLPLEARIVSPDLAGIALVYGTGSNDHQKALLQHAENRGSILRDDGLFANDDRIAAESESAIYAALGLDWIPPELREARGEIEAAASGELPDLIAVDDIRGDLQMHTTYSDGENALAEMAEAARARGYAYIAMTDHSQRMRVANGLTPQRLREQMAEIDALNAEYDDFFIFKSCEVDILEDGTLDMPDAILDELDLVVASVHSRFDLDRDAQTERMVRAMAHPSVNVLAHPTGRILNRRDPYDVDMERIMEAAAECGVCLEINASPQRLDLKDEHIQMAKELGVKLLISTDAHRTSELDHMRYGVDQARRGWLSADDVLNTLDVTGFRERVRRR